MNQGSGFFLVPFLFDFFERFMYLSGWCKWVDRGI